MRTDKSPNRNRTQPAIVDEIRGYLHETLGPATFGKASGVNRDTLLPGEARMAVFARNTAGEWLYVSTHVVVNYDAGVSIPARHYVRASRNEVGEYEQFYYSCDAQPTVEIPEIEV
jgi:hypothetical protein